MARTMPLGLFALALALAGCTVGPDYRQPALELPETWPAAPAQATAADRVGERWWSLYRDPVLDRLMDEALVHNADLQAALARVREARALAGIADADRYPAVSARFSKDRTRSSLEGSFPLPEDFPRTLNNHRATLDAAWEVDLWGKYSRASEASRAEFLAAEWARQGVRLSLAAQVAREYFALLAADGQLATAQRTLATRNETLALFRRRLEVGAISEYDLRQAEAEVAIARSQLAALALARDRNESALALLLGRSPRQVMAGAIERGAPAPLAETAVPAGLPSDLLLRRPDLQEAEQRLVAANARIGAARAQYFPAVSLTAYLGSESVAFSNLFTGPTGIFQFAATMTQTLWDGGRIGWSVEASEARRGQALAQYRQAVAAAFRDVRDALAAQASAQETLAAESARSEALALALRQARQQFNAGQASWLEVLDVERNLLDAELARIDAERARKAALADLFKALGGGWEKPEG
ncbi:MAG: efflux system, outer rane lipoprotein, NodT family [Rhodocyclaceae bacterium]|nr:efflux system, outer rane lipoprotein, NodT family [Rhodocyclaceae bacterium]